MLGLRERRIRRRSFSSPLPTALADDEIILEYSFRHGPRRRWRSANSRGGRATSRSRGWRFSTIRTPKAARARQHRRVGACYVPKRLTTRIKRSRASASTKRPRAPPRSSRRRSRPDGGFPRSSGIPQGAGQHAARAGVLSTRHSGVRQNPFDLDERQTGFRSFARCAVRNDDLLMNIAFELNGKRVEADIPVRTTLVDGIRHHSSDRHARRLRARSLWRVHRHRRRRGGALVSHARGAGGRLEGHDGRGPDAGGGSFASAGLVSKAPCAAMRLLHAGFPDDRACAAHAGAECERGKNPSRASATGRVTVYITSGRLPRVSRMARTIGNDGQRCIRRDAGRAHEDLRCCVGRALRRRLTRRRRSCDLRSRCRTADQASTRPRSQCRRSGHIHGRDIGKRQQRPCPDDPCASRR